jgi:tetratricopeptide (TPR) repeat protein
MTYGHMRVKSLWPKNEGIVVVPQDHPNVATSLNNLATLYRDQGRYAEAEPLYQRSLVISEKTLGKDHPTTKTVTSNLQRLRVILYKDT